MDQQNKNDFGSFMEKLNDQDSKQKIGMYMAFIMEFYRVLMGSFLIVFVPQKCGDSVCGIFENVITGKPIIDTAFSMNLSLFFIYLVMYYIELTRENTMINYLEVNPSLARDNETVGDVLLQLPEEKRNALLYLDKKYQMIGRVGIIGFIINLGFSGYVIFTHYLDNKTVTVLLTNVLFMGMKLNDVKVITETDTNIFLSAYLTKKIQYNDVDPDKKIQYNDVDPDKKIQYNDVDPDKKILTIDVPV